MYEQGAAGISLQFANRTVFKTYTAIVTARPPPDQRPSFSEDASEARLSILDCLKCAMLEIVVQ